MTGTLETQTQLIPPTCVQLCVDLSRKLFHRVPVVPCDSAYEVARIRERGTSGIIRAGYFDLLGIRGAVQPTAAGDQPPGELVLGRLSIKCSQKALGLSDGKQNLRVSAFNRLAKQPHSALDRS
jgi:hypothetical protein